MPFLNHCSSFVVDLADLRAADALDAGKEVKSGVFLQIVSLVPKILEETESKSLFSLPTLNTHHHVQHHWG